jgi:hypothetical protein
MTYLDEVMTKKRLGPAVALVNLIHLMGFSIAYVLGAYLLTLHVTLGTPPNGLTPESGQWVGAWWMGFLVPGLLLTLTGIPIILFPTQMPAAKVLKQRFKKLLIRMLVSQIW